MRIVYMGTPDFTVYPLEDLLAAGHEVVAVFTKENKPKGRGQKMVQPALMKFAQSHNIPIFTPTTLRNTAIQEKIASFDAETIVVFAYSLILPAEILYMPKYGCINIHPSLLPLWRGASPVASSILHGDSVGGVSVMHMDEGLDTGAVFGQLTVEIDEQDTTAILTDKLARLSGSLLCKVLDSLQVGQICPLPQDNSAATYSVKFEKESGLLDFNLSAYDLKRRVMAYNPWPCAYTFLHGKMLKILTATYSIDSAVNGLETGSVVAFDNSFAIVTGKGLLVPLSVQLEGKKAVSASDFRNGAGDLLNAKLG